MSYDDRLRIMGYKFKELGWITIATKENIVDLIELNKIKYIIGEKHGTLDEYVKCISNNEVIVDEGLVAELSIRSNGDSYIVLHRYIDRVNSVINKIAILYRRKIFKSCFISNIIDNDTVIYSERGLDGYYIKLYDFCIKKVYKVKVMTPFYVHTINRIDRHCFRFGERGTAYFEEGKWCEGK